MTFFIQDEVNAAIKTERDKTIVQCRKSRILFSIKPAGFSKSVFIATSYFAYQTFHLVTKQWKRHRDRLHVKKMLTLSNESLDDINIKLADILFVLRTKSPLLPSERLKLLSMERRSLLRQDQERRKTYLEELVPAPFNGCFDQNKRQNKTNA